MKASESNFKGVLYRSLVCTQFLLYSSLSTPIALPTRVNPYPSYSFIAKSSSLSSSTPYSSLTPPLITPSQCLQRYPSKALRSCTLFNNSCSQTTSNPHFSQNFVLPTPNPQPSTSTFSTCSSYLSNPANPPDLSLSLSAIYSQYFSTSKLPPHFSTNKLLLDLIVKSILPLLYSNGLSEDGSLIMFTLRNLLSSTSNRGSST